MHVAGEGSGARSAGFVLVGGNSSRMGNDKALLPFGAGVLVSHIADAVARAAGNVHLIGPQTAYRHLPFQAISDLYPGFGPVGGILTALSQESAEWNLIVACDMPGISIDLLESLLAKAKTSDAECILPVTPDGRRHPLCAAYHRTATPVLRRAVEEGIHRLQTAIQPLQIHDLPVSEPSWLLNVNTPAEWSAFQNAVR